MAFVAPYPAQRANARVAREAPALPVHASGRLLASRETEAKFGVMLEFHHLTRDRAAWQM